MSDWVFLNKHRVTNEPRIDPAYWTSWEAGFNGMFRFMLESKFIRCVASDGMDWQHVSATEEGSFKPLPWGIMCKLKALFWDDEDWVVQFHPARSQYKNVHNGCLHLWRYTGKEFTQPTPQRIMV